MVHGPELGLFACSTVANSCKLCNLASCFRVPFNFVFSPSQVSLLVHLPLGQGTLLNFIGSYALSPTICGLGPTRQPCLNPWLCLWSGSQAVSVHDWPAEVWQYWPGWQSALHTYCLPPSVIPLTLPCKHPPLVQAVGTDNKWSNTLLKYSRKALSVGFKYKNHETSLPVLILQMQDWTMYIIHR